jgi:hypothetical protein
MLNYYQIPFEWQNKVRNAFGDPSDNTDRDKLSTYIKLDYQAAKFFSDYITASGKPLSMDKQMQLRANAEVLDGIANMMAVRNFPQGINRMAALWRSLAKAVQNLDTERFPCNLPSDYKKLRQKFDTYRADSYPALLHSGEGNSNSRKVNDALERLILSLYAMPTKPYGTSVASDFRMFIDGRIEVFDAATGEYFDPKMFYKKDEPMELSQSTIWNYINNPKNRPVLDSLRNDAHAYNNMHRPHAHRHAPAFSLSKISMDDRDLPRKMLDGNRVKAYYAYDVASTCVVGASYSKNKDKELFTACLNDMFRFINSNSLGMPLEVEVEHHLVNKFKDDLMQAGTVFPFVRWCNPGNSQEKHAEYLNKAKKYGYEKRTQNGIGRFYAKLEANRPKQDKVWNDDGMVYKEEKFSYEQLVADDRKTIEAYNNDLHPKQNLYPGMTRLQVLQQNANPEAPVYNRSILARYVGSRTDTSIRRNQYFSVQNQKYALPSVEVLNHLQPGKLEVEAYWFAEADGSIDEVYLYQGDKFLCRSERMATFNTATAEQTEADRTAMTEQQKYIKSFDKQVKTKRTALAKISIMTKLDDTITADAIMEAVEVPVKEPTFEVYNATDLAWYRSKALNDI